MILLLTLAAISILSSAWLLHEYLNPPPHDDAFCSPDHECAECNRWLDLLRGDVFPERKDRSA